MALGLDLIELVDDAGLAVDDQVDCVVIGREVDVDLVTQLREGEGEGEG